MVQCEWKCERHGTAEHTLELEMLLYKGVLKKDMVCYKCCGYDDGGQHKVGQRFWSCFVH